MKAAFNLKPLKELLTTGITPGELANLLTELTQSYTQAMDYISVHEVEELENIQKNRNSQLDWLQKLIDSLQACENKEKDS